MCAKTVKLNLKSFLSRAQARHGSRYDYSQLVYESAHNKVTIHCPQHGFFEQTPGSHLAGRGCPKCGDDAASDKLKKPVQYWLDRFHEKHGQRYSYPDLRQEVKHCDRIRITCPVHGVFTQEIIVHSRGHGCRKCNQKSNGMGWRRGDFVRICQGREALLYIILCTGKGESFYKVGITSRPLAKRFDKTSMPYNYALWIEWRSADAAAVWDLEKLLHRQFKHLKYKPALSFAGQTECFTSVAPMLPYLPPDAVLGPP